MAHQLEDNMDLETREIDRIRTLTEGGKEQFDETRAKYASYLDKGWSNVQMILEKISDSEEGDINKMEGELIKHYNGYSDLCHEYMDFLKRARTQESINELRLMERIVVGYDAIYRGGIKQIQALRNIDIRSVRTTSSKRREANARLEVVKQKLELAEKEAFMCKQQQIQADLNVLHIKREAFEVEAEAKAASEHSGDQEMTKPKINVPVDKDRTERYVQEHFIRPKCDFPGNTNPEQLSQQVTAISNSQSLASDLTSFLLKKDLMLTRLSTFDDQPEHYSAWKENFRSIMKELKVLPSEEIDLLVRWLGPESCKHARTIKTAMSYDPSWGLLKIWERLDERFGAPEIIEASIKQKINLFPKLSNKENKKLYDLVDIMIEIEMLMRKPEYNLLLSYFNSSSGVLPIISKLPYGIQEKWTTRASSYKKAHNVPFPPFSYAVDFVKEMSKVRNDPAFSYMYDQSNVQGNVKSTSPRQTSHNKPVIARKTEVHGTCFESNSIQTCPLHLKDHSLNDCREFAKWDFAKRKEFLKKKVLKTDKG